jgi:predicted SprT family Zn-dependent metalloprotease
MRDLNLVAIECMKMLDDIGIKYGNVKEFKINTRARRWGQCKRITGGYSINISATLLDERNDIDGLKNTIIHELLHTCDGCMNHGEKWKAMAKKVHQAYGYNIKRCSDTDEKGVKKDTRPKQKAIKYKYEVKCKKCGNVYQRSKMSNVIQHPEHYTCGKCHGELVRTK